MNQLIKLIIFIAIGSILVAFSIFKLGQEMSYIALSRYLYSEIDQVSFYFRNIKELREEQESKIMSNVLRLLKEDKEGENIIEGERRGTKHFVDYSTQKIAKEDKKITYSVLVDDYLCNYLIEKTEKKDDMCTKNENDSIYTYVLYKE